MVVVDEFGGTWRMADREGHPANQSTCGRGLVCTSWFASYPGRARGQSLRPLRYTVRKRWLCARLKEAWRVPVGSTPKAPWILPVANLQRVKLQEVVLAGISVGVFTQVGFHY